MELKRGYIPSRTIYGKLLIVPYGIETDNREDVDFLLSELLIVPYGIETRRIIPEK